MGRGHPAKVAAMTSLFYDGEFSTAQKKVQSWWDCSPVGLSLRTVQSQLGNLRLGLDRENVLQYNMNERSFLFS
jgi:hypothetical protein